jgi:hypothetical protein
MSAIDPLKVFEVVKYVGTLLTLFGILWGAFKALSLLGRVFKSLQKFLDEQLPTISTSLDTLKEHADLAMSNHLPHIQVAAESMATSLGRLTTNFRDYELNDAKVQTTIISQLSEVRNDIREKL